MTTITELPAKLAAHRIAHGQGEIIKGGFTIRLMTIMYRTWDYGRG